MQIDTKRWGHARPTRQGSAAVLIMIMIAVFVVMAAITIDYSYMQLLRTELRGATDAASKAGAEALGRSQSTTFAKQEAIRYAAANKVGGRPFALSANDIEIGKVTRNNVGRWDFQLNGSPPNAVRVNARTGNTAAHPSIPLFFGRVLGQDTFSPSYRATAGQQDVEVCLCLDRSGSMLFDMSGVDYSYPTGNPRLSTFNSWGSTWQNHLSAPHPVHSRWAVLSRAIRLFFDEAALSTPQPRASLVTWASRYDMPVSPFTNFPESQNDVLLPPLSGLNFATNRQAIFDAVDHRSVRPMMGATNLSAGLTQAIASLQGSSSSALSSKVIILLTDGQWNTGADPVSAATTARNAGITVHCVSMLTSSQPSLQQIATITNGRYFLTSNEAELRSAFQELARSLPVVLTD